MKKLLSFCAITLMMAAVSGCGSNNPEDTLGDNGNGVQNEADNNGNGAQDDKDKKGNGWPDYTNDTASYQIVLTDAQKETIKQTNGFALNYLKKVSGQNQTEGFVTSPLSTATVLGMLSAGAQGKTHADIVSVLLGNGSSEGLNELFLKLATELPVADRAVSLKQANCLVGDVSGERVLESEVALVLNSEVDDLGLVGLPEGVRRIVLRNVGNRVENVALFAGYGYVSAIGSFIHQQVDLQFTGKDAVVAALNAIRKPRERSSGEHGEAHRKNKQAAYQRALR